MPVGLKRLRRIATRYEKRAADVLAMIKIATVRIRLRAYEFASWNGLATISRPIILAKVSRRAV